MPVEGDLADEPRIGDIARGDVATCRLGDRVRDIDAKHGLCVVVNDERIILGDVRARTLSSVDPDSLVEDEMRPGPSTYRPNVSIHEMAHHLAETSARRVLVSDGDGHLIGVLLREDVERALARSANGPVLANQDGKEAHSHG